MRAWDVCLLAVAWAVYGGTSFVGGLVASTHKTVSPFVVLYWMLMGRGIGGVCASAVAWVVGRPDDPRTALTWGQIAAPSLLPTVGNVGWLAYFALSRTQHVSVLMPLLSTYIVLPVGYSLATRKETCSVLKTCGVGLVLATGVLLGLEVTGGSSESSGADGSKPGSSSGWMVALLFVATLLAWGLSDTISSSVPKGSITARALLGLNTAGYVFNAAVVGVGVHVSRQDLPASALPALAWWAAVNTLYPVGWTAYTTLCRSHDGVVIVPLFGMYILVPAVGGLAISGDPATPFTIAGVLCGALASVLLAWKTTTTARDPGPVDTMVAVESP